MKILIVEDDFTSRKILTTILQPYGQFDIAVNGVEAVEAFRKALYDGQPYDLICLDIMMPEKDGQVVLKEIRKIEIIKEVEGLDRAKIIMTTALSDSASVMDAFRSQCEAYLPKPIAKKQLLDQMRILELIE